MWLAGEKEISRVVLPKLMEMCLRQQVALLYRQEEEKTTLHTETEYISNSLTKKSASCRLPSRVISSPGNMGSV